MRNRGAMLCLSWSGLLTWECQCTGLVDGWVSGWIAQGRRRHGCMLIAARLLAPVAGGFNPQFLPELRGIMVLFSRLLTAASLWVHLLATNLFAARAVYLQGAAVLFCGGQWWQGGPVASFCVGQGGW